MARPETLIHGKIYMNAWIFEMMSCIIARSKMIYHFRDVICFEVWRVAHVSICNRPALYSDNSIILLILLLIHHSPYIVDSRSDPISVGCTIFRVARRYFRVFFSYGASQAKSERRARWTACKDAAGRQTRRATSDRVAHYRRGVFRSLRVPNVFYSDVLSFMLIYRILLQIFGYVTKVQSIDRVLISRVVASLRERGNRAAA